MKRFLQIGLLVAALAWCVPAQATWTFKQARCTGTTTTDACTTGTTCTVSSLTAITAGSSLLAIMLNDVNNTIRITSINGETWTHCTAGTAACGQNSTIHAVDASYVVSATGGETSFIFTLNATIAGANVCIVEVKSDSTPSFDNNNGTTGTVASTVNVTLAGSNDFLVAAMATAGSLSAVSGTGWNNTACSNTCFPNGDGIAWNINQSSGTGANFSNGTNAEANFTFAFKEAAAGGAANRLPALGVGIVLIGFFSGILLGIYDTGRKHVFQGSVGADSYDDGRLLGVYNHDADSKSPLFTAVLEDGVWVVPTIQVASPARTPLKSLVN